MDCLAVYGIESCVGGLVREAESRGTTMPAPESATRNRLSIFLATQNAEDGVYGAVAVFFTGWYSPGTARKAMAMRFQLLMLAMA